MKYSERKNSVYPSLHDITIEPIIKKHLQKNE